MRQFILILLLSFSLSQTMIAEQPFSKKPAGKPDLIQKGPSKMWCPICGMSLKGNYKTNHGITLKDGETRQYCSIRCLVVDHQHHGEPIDKSLVVDVTSEKLIPAKQAVYVIGSRARGTMTMKSKYAFAEKGDAIAFQKKFGGKLADFQGAVAAAKQSMAMDIAMTNKKRQARMYPMGKKLYQKRCEPIKLEQYTRINTLKAAIKFKKLCGVLPEKQAQAVALYLWDIKRLEGKQAPNIIQITKTEKCPVCGMFVYKYPKWAAQLFFMHDGHLDHASFDGVKDMMKFYFAPNQWGAYQILDFSKILVTDYYTQQAIPGNKAWFVTGSNILGPMGHELIPVQTKQDAETFKRDHRGDHIYRFDQITPELIRTLDQ